MNLINPTPIEFAHMHVIAGAVVGIVAMLLAYYAWANKDKFMVKVTMVLLFVALLVLFTGLSGPPPHLH